MSQLIRNLVFIAILTSIGASSAQTQPQLPPPPPPPPATMRSLPLPKPVVANPAPVSFAPALAPAATPAVPQATNTTGGKIQFASTVHDFGKVKAGDPVKISFTFTNTGQSALEVTAVQPQCGCTVAGDWTKKVDPGQSGEIPLQFNTANYHGQVFKTITVSCSDPMQPHIMLQLKGNIWKPIDLVPPYTVMNILPDMASATATVKIINNMEQPVQIMSPQLGITGFSVELQTNQPGKEFQLTIKAAMPLNPGTLSGKVTLKTSSTNTPTLDVPFWANVQAPVMVLPPQVMIPSGPLSAAANPAVTIQNNTTNILSVSEPKVTVPGVGVQVRELQPGKIFSVQMSFPDGFQLKPGEQALLTFKTSHPRFAEVKVPIVQMAKPMTPRLTPPTTVPLHSKAQASPMLPAANIAAPTASAAAH